MTRVYINGKLHDKDDAKVSVYDHGLLYGDGVFEGIRVYNSKVFRHDDHLARDRGDRPADLDLHAELQASDHAPHLVDADLHWGALRSRAAASMDGMP